MQAEKLKGEEKEKERLAYEERGRGEKGNLSSPSHLEKREEEEEEKEEEEV